MPDLMLHPRTGELIARDDTPFEVWLAVHGQSKSGKAWLVSATGVKRDSFWMPKAMVELGEPCAGFERMDDRCQRVLIPVHLASMPKFKAIEKGLAA